MYKYKHKVQYCERTSSAYPSQWDIYTDEDHRFYAHYRQGVFTLVQDEVDTLMYLNYGGEYDGVMDTHTMMELTADFLDWSLCM